MCARRRDRPSYIGWARLQPSFQLNTTRRLLPDHLFAHPSLFAFLRSLNPFRLLRSRIDTPSSTDYRVGRAPLRRPRVDRSSASLDLYRSGQTRSRTQTARGHIAGIHRGAHRTPRRQLTITLDYSNSNLQTSRMPIVSVRYSSINRPFPEKSDILPGILCYK
jgi:hypothetical protein